MWCRAWSQTLIRGTAMPGLSFYELLQKEVLEPITMTSGLCNEQPASPPALLPMANHFWEGASACLWPSLAPGGCQDAAGAPSLVCMGEPGDFTAQKLKLPNLTFNGYFCLLSIFSCLPNQSPLDLWCALRAAMNFKTCKMTEY